MWVTENYGACRNFLQYNVPETFFQYWELLGELLKMDKATDNYEKKMQALQTKLEQVKKAKLLAEQREKSKKSELKRKIDLRQKILVGAMVIEQVKRGEVSQEKILSELDKFLTRPKDRALFGLS